MANRTTIRCNVCGCETAITNIQPGRKIFCLHCGRVITDSYQPGMEYQSGADYQQSVNYQQGTTFNPPPQASPIPEETVIPPPPPIDNSHSQQEYAPEPPQPSWMTEPYIRVNWKRIGYTIKTVFKGIVTFFSKRWADFREGLRSDTNSTAAEPQQSEEWQNVPPSPDVTSQPPVQEPETPFGYVDRRQARMQQSFSRNFADSGAIPVPPSNPNYSQQRIDQSFTNSFADTGAIPVPPSNPNYSQQRIDESFTKSFQENENKQA